MYFYVYVTRTLRLLDAPRLAHGTSDKHPSTPTKPDALRLCFGGGAHSCSHYQLSAQDCHQQQFLHPNFGLVALQQKHVCNRVAHCGSICT